MSGQPRTLRAHFAARTFDRLFAAYDRRMAAPDTYRHPDEIAAGLICAQQNFEPRPLAPLAVRRAVVEAI